MLELHNTCRPNKSLDMLWHVAAIYLASVACSMRCVPVDHLSVPKTVFWVLKRIAEDTPRSIREINPRVPLWLECIVNKLLAKRVDQRPQSATLVNQLLAQSLKHVQNSLGAPLPNLAVEWMNEIKAAQSAANKKTVVGVFSAFTQKRYVVVGVLALIIVGLLLTTDRLPYFSGTARTPMQAVQQRPIEILRHQTSATISPQESVQNAPFDLDLEWDTAINAARSLQLEVDELERKLRQESSDNISPQW